MNAIKNPMTKLATLTAATVAVIGLGTSQAQAADPLLGALIGGGIGAAIGDSSHHRNGAAVGGVLGAIVGSSIAADSNRYYGGDRYYDNRYYSRGYYDAAPVYYEPRYYRPAPVYGYYAPPPVTITYSSGRYYDRGHRHRHHRNW